jgi:hypothetical protein
LRASDLLLVIIGPGWLGKTPGGKTRINEKPRSDPARNRNGADVGPRYCARPCWRGGHAKA